MRKIVRILQAYKGAWRQLFRPQGEDIHLSWDREKKEIVVEAPPNSPEFDKNTFLSRTYRQIWDVKHFIPSLLTISVVEDWLRNLTSEEAEAIFWRFINHDWERSSVEEQLNGMPPYRTLSYREIAHRMNCSHAHVRDLCENALQKIREIAFEHYYPLISPYRVLTSVYKK